MKKHSFKIRSIAVGLLASLLTLTISVPALANRKVQADSASQAIQPSVTFLRSEDNSSLFTVSLENETPVKFELVIKDAVGEEIFKETYETSKFSKVFKVVNESVISDPLGLSFQIRVLPNGVKHNFEVSTTIEHVKEIEITKL